MTTTHIPAIERKPPGRFAIGVAVVFLYLIVLPLTWVMKKLGIRNSLLKNVMYRQLGKGGPERAFRNYVPASHDVLVCTYAKSGTNWMMQMAHQIAFHGEGDYAHIHDVVSWPDMDPKASHMFSVGLDTDYVQQQSPAGLRVIKTHLSARYVPYNRDAHYIVVIRDPKEVFVSSYHFVNSSFGPLMPEAQQWFELFLSPRFPMNFGSTWAQHVASYWALRDQPNVLILSYTGMKADLPGTVARVAGFLGVELDSEAFDKVVKKSAFAYMKAIDDKFLPMPKGTTPWGDMEMMRQGETGNSRELISPLQQQQIDEHCQAELTRLGSDFPYQDFCRSAGAPAAVK